KQLGVWRGTISSALSREGVAVRDSSRSDIYDAEICRLYLSGKSFESIAESLGISMYIVRRALYRNQIRIRHGSDYTRTVSTDEDEYRIVELYTAAKSSYEVARLLSISSDIVC